MHTTIGLHGLKMAGRDRRIVEANHEQLVGIGECGLDFQQWAVPTDEHKLTQRWALEQQIRLARYLHNPWFAEQAWVHGPSLFFLSY
jgi:Tat protein secretion system quality control protein TatD with DNase activity